MAWCDLVILSVCSSFPPFPPEKKIKGSEADLALWPCNSCRISFWTPGVKPKLRSAVLRRAAQACAGGRGAGPGGRGRYRRRRAGPPEQPAPAARAELCRPSPHLCAERLGGSGRGEGPASVQPLGNWRAAGWGPGLLPQKRRGVPAESPSPAVGRGVRETAFLRGSRSRRPPFGEPAPLGRSIRWMTRCSVKGLC